MALSHRVHAVCFCLSAWWTDLGSTMNEASIFRPGAPKTSANGSVQLLDQTAAGCSWLVGVI